MEDGGDGPLARIGPPLDAGEEQAHGAAHLLDGGHDDGAGQETVRARPVPLVIDADDARVVPWKRLGDGEEGLKRLGGVADDGGGTFGGQGRHRGEIIRLVE